MEFSVASPFSFTASTVIQQAQNLRQTGGGCARLCKYASKNKSVQFATKKNIFF